MYRHQIPTPQGSCNSHGRSRLKSALFSPRLPECAALSLGWHLRGIPGPPAQCLPPKPQSRVTQWDTARHTVQGTVTPSPAEGGPCPGNLLTKGSISPTRAGAVIPDISVRTEQENEPQHKRRDSVPAPPPQPVTAISVFPEGGELWGNYHRHGKFS